MEMTLGALGIRESTDPVARSTNRLKCLPDITVDYS